MPPLGMGVLKSTACKCVRRYSAVRGCSLNRRSNPPRLDTRSRIISSRLFMTSVCCASYTVSHLSTTFSLVSAARERFLLPATDSRYLITLCLRKASRHSSGRGSTGCLPGTDQTQCRLSPNSKRSIAFLISPDRRIAPMVLTSCLLLQTSGASVLAFFSPGRNASCPDLLLMINLFTTCSSFSFLRT